MVWTRRSGSAGSPLMLIGTSPTPNTESMLNWPGAKARRPSPFSLEVERPHVAARRAGAGARARCAAPSDRQRSVADRRRQARAAIDIENLQPGRLQALDQDRHEALHHLVAEIVVGLALVAQAGRVDGDRAGELTAPGVEGPAIGRDQPGDADDLALADGLERDCAPRPGAVISKRHPAVPDQIELVGRLAFAEQVLARPRSARSCAQPQTSLQNPSSSPAKNGCSLTMRSSPDLHGVASSMRLAVADGAHLLGDVDADRAPGDAAAAADAAGRAELVDPGGELVGHPLAIARACA